MKKIANIFVFVLIPILFSCGLSDNLLAKKMIKKYSDNKNYVELFGKIVEYSENVMVIQCVELKKYIEYEDEMCSYYVHSNRVLDIVAGDYIDFTTVPFHFYNGHKLPIVSLKKNDKTLLEFEEGKENLIEWVKLTFM